MYAGFPVDQLQFLLCQSDGAALQLAEADHESSFLSNAILRCVGCDAQYEVQDGIVRLLDSGSLDFESEHERGLRDREFDDAWDPRNEASDHSLAEILPTLQELAPLAGRTVLELGAGAGRYTVRLASQGARVLAIDFSIEALRRQAARADASWTLGLVQGDCTQVRVQAGAFDLVLSTLVSNLPTPEHRAAMMRLAARSLRPEGRFVFGAHHYSLHSRRLGELPSGRYEEGHVFRYLFRRREIETETRSFFSDVRCRPVVIEVPFARRLGLGLVSTSRVAERIPLLNLFGAILLVVAQRPKTVTTTD